MDDDYGEDILKCPVCRDIPENINIFVCANGHSICARCQSTITDCPVCQEKYDVLPTRNLQIEQLIYATVTRHPCRNAREGCTMKGRQREIRLHEATCDFELVLCDKGCKKLTQVQSAVK